MLTWNLDGTCLWAPHFFRAALFWIINLNFLNLAGNNFIDQLGSLILSILIVFNYSLIWLHHEALLWTSSVLELVLTVLTHSFSVLDLVVLGRRILHRDQSTSWWTLCLVKKICSLLIIKLILELLEKILGGLFGSLQLFHFLPYIFNGEVQELLPSFRLLLQSNWLDRGSVNSENVIVLQNSLLFLFLLLHLTLGFAHLGLLDLYFTCWRSLHLNLGLQCLHTLRQVEFWHNYSLLWRLFKKGCLHLLSLGFNSQCLFGLFFLTYVLFKSVQTLLARHRQFVLRQILSAFESWSSIKRGLLLIRSFWANGHGCPSDFGFGEVFFYERLFLSFQSGILLFYVNEGEVLTVGIRRLGLELELLYWRSIHVFLAQHLNRLEFFERALGSLFFDFYNFARRFLPWDNLFCDLL